MKLHNLALCLLLVAVPTTLRAQTVESLLIGPGDLVHIHVFETSDLDQDVRVTDAGDVPLVLGGEVKIAGMTPAQAGAAVADVLKQRRYLLSPHVEVTIKQYVTQTVSILGQVRSPGSYELHTPRTILEVISLAGGITELADHTLTIARGDSGERRHYLLSNDPKVALDRNLLVYPGDTVLVPRVDEVYVLGDVGRPGGYAASTNDSKLTALQAVSLAGSAAPTAATSHAFLLRKNEDGSYRRVALPLGEMEKGKKPDMVLQGDDILYIPFSYLKNFAIGSSGLVAAASTAAVYRF